MRIFRLIAPLLISFTLAGCGGGGGDGIISQIANVFDEVPVVDIKTKALYSEAAYIPSQCYTSTPFQCIMDTKDANGQTLNQCNSCHSDETSKDTHKFFQAYNPCYSCHRDSIEPNYVNDSDLQEENSFPLLATKNKWTNLFVDASADIAKISDEEIAAYVSKSNYDSNGVITLAEKLKNLPTNWDIDGDKKWDGYTPDCYFNFDDEGFDKNSKGEYTGWRAFAYYPFLGTFWPTNGSTDDVIIRLPDTFRKNASGSFDKETYKTNLAIVESVIKKKDVAISKIDESKYGVDLDINGKIGYAEKIKYSYEQGKPLAMSYVGYAKKALSDGGINLAGGLFPVGTEFLHSVRYIDASKTPVGLGARMKELKYSKKIEWLGYEKLAIIAGGVAREKEGDPNKLETFSGDAERGLKARGGWVYQGFIEDAGGDLRPQNYEETLFCMGCHGGVGATTDTIFAFARKFESPNTADGWYHWSKKGLQGVKEPINVDGLGEYSRYLEKNKAGDEFRANNEVIAKFFDTNGALKSAEVAKMKEDISYLLLPSKERAVKLNKAYRALVKKQTFIYGRDTMISPATNVNKEVIQNSSTGISAIR